jgi:hypothetical protein
MERSIGESLHGVVPVTLSMISPRDLSRKNPVFTRSTARLSVLCACLAAGDAGYSLSCICANLTFRDKSIDLQALPQIGV